MPWKTFSAVVLSLLVVAPVTARNQSGDNWYFGDAGGLTFVSGTPAPLSGGAINTMEGCATISDSSGNLLFYTDGITVWNRSHAVMPNGTGLLGDSSATQSGVIVPSPAGGNIYYVFTVPSTGGAGNGLRCSVVDLSLDSGNGAVVAESKNTRLNASTSEQVTAVAHANGRDIWVIARETGSNNFDAFLVTSDGINTTAVVSGAGTTTGAAELGYLKSSTDGSHLAMAYYSAGKAEVYDFDASTGTVSNAVNLGSLASAYGVEFSQDGTRLYIAGYMRSVWQFDLTAGDIAASKITLANGGSSAALQLGPDGKIYVANSGGNSLGYIDSPNTLGADCGYHATGIAISGGCLAGLPTFIQTFFAAGADFSTAENTALPFAQADFTDPYHSATAGTLVQIKVTALPAHGSLAVGATPIGQNDVIAVGDVATIHYTPDTYWSGNDSFAWEGDGGSGYNFSATFRIEVTAVAQEPTCTLPTGLVIGTQTTDGLVIDRNEHDGSEVTHFQITTISGGALYQHDGTTAINDGDFITYAEGNAGLRFTLSAASCGFTIAGATSADPNGVSPTTHEVSFATLTAPSVTTAAAANITATTAASGGEVTSDGGSTVLVRGVCWSTTDSPTTADSFTEDGSGSGQFTSTLSELTPATTYHVRAYATNALGTEYGEDLTFTTAEQPQPDPTPPDLRVDAEPGLDAAANGALVGDDLPFLLTIENAGQTGATNVTLSVPLPENLEFVSGRVLFEAAAQAVPAEFSVQDGVVLIRIGDLPAGEQVRLELVLRATAAGTVQLSVAIGSDETAELVTSALVGVTIADDYYTIVQESRPELCGLPGIFPLLVALGLVGLKRRQPRVR